MRSSSSWLLNNVFRDAAASIWEYKLANLSEASGNINEVALSSISTAVTLQLMQKLGIKESDLTPEVFKELNGYVKASISDIDLIISNNIKTEYEKRTKRNPELRNDQVAVYKAILEESKHVIPTKVTKLQINSHLDAIYEIEKVKEKLAPMLAKSSETVKAGAAVTKVLSDRLPAEQTAFTDKPQTSVKEGVSAGYIAKGKKPENLGVTFMLKNTLLKPDQDGSLEFRVEICVAALQFAEQYGYYTKMNIENALKLDLNLSSIDLNDTNEVAKAITSALKARYPNGEEDQDVVKLFLSNMSAILGPLVNVNDSLVKAYNRGFERDYGQYYGDFRNTNYDAMSFFNEFLMAPLYEKMLYDRTPVIAGVKATAEQEVFLRSRFLPGFQTASQHTGAAEPSQFGAGNFAGVIGAGKLLAALLAGGEFDIHAGNFGVMTESRLDETTRQNIERSVFSKIDHGWSATQLFTSGEAMWQNLNNACAVYNYKSKDIKKKNNIDINIKELRESLDQILKLSPSYIEDQVKARMYQLKAMGFNPIGLEFSIWTDDIEHNYNVSRPAKFRVSISIDQYNKASESQKKVLLKQAYAELENLYTDRFKNHWKALAEFRDLAEVAEKLCKASGEEPEKNWVKGKWINHLNGQNPIQYALEKGLKIKEIDLDGIPKYISPLVYAIDKGMKIDGEAIAYAISKGLRFQKKEDINGVTKHIDILDYAIEKGIEINGKNPALYGLEESILIKRVDSAGVAKYIDPLLYLIEKGIEINGENPIVYAVKQNKRIKERDSNGREKKTDPLAYVIDNGIEINGENPIVYAEQNGLKIKVQDPNGSFKFVSPLDYAVDHNLMIGEQSVIELAIGNGFKIHGIDATIYALCYDIKIKGKDAIDFAKAIGVQIDINGPQSIGSEYMDPISFKAEIDSLSPKQYKELLHKTLAAASLPIPEHLQPTHEIAEVPAPPSPAKQSGSPASPAFIEKIKSQHMKEIYKGQPKSNQKSSFSSNILNERQDAGKSKSPNKD